MKPAQRLSASHNRRRSDTPIDGDVVKAEIDGLSGLGIGELRARWLEVVGRPAPLAFRRAFLARALAHEIQVKAYGGLSSATMRRLRELVIAAREDRFDEALGASSVKPGTLLIRVWQGTTHRVMAAKDGFIWNGDGYGSLSTIAKAITGTSWNGWTFFGLKRPTRRNKNARRMREPARNNGRGVGGSGAEADGPAAELDLVTSDANRLAGPSARPHAGLHSEMAAAGESDHA